MRSVQCIDSHLVEKGIVLCDNVKVFEYDYVLLICLFEFFITLICITLLVPCFMDFCDTLLCAFIVFFDSLFLG